MRISAKRIFTATLLAGLAGCASVQVSAPPAQDVAPAPVAGAHWRFDDARPPADGDGYRPPRKLAVLLPMSGALATAAGSVRDGLLAGYYGERRQRPELVFYDTLGTAAGASAAHARAISEGADQIVGPLAREEVAAIYATPPGPPAIALNSTAAAAPLNVASYALSPEDEGAAAADYLLARNAKRVLVLSNGDDNAVRAVNVLRERLRAAGGDIVDTVAVVSDKPGDMTPALRAAAAKEGGVDAVLLAIRGNQARLIAPQLFAAGLGQRLRVATSQITSGTGKPEEDRALDGIAFPAEPWVIGAASALPGAASLGKELPTARGPAARLFAFGYDAWQLSVYLQHLATHGDARISGATGTLRIDADGNVLRTPAWAAWSSGVPVPLQGG